MNFYLTTLSMSVNALFGLLKFANALEIRFYYFYSPRIINVTIFSPTIDFWIWTISLAFTAAELILGAHRNPSIPRWTVLPCLSAILSLAVFLINTRSGYLLAVPLGFAVVSLSIYYGNGHLIAGREERAFLTLVCITGIWIFLEVASALSWTLNAFDYEVPFGSTLRWRFPWIDLQLFNLMYPANSWLYLALLYSWIWIPALRYTLRTISAKSGIPRAKPVSPSPIQNANSEPKLNKKCLTLGLLLSFALAGFIAYYPYIHLPSSMLVGADSMQYYDWLRDMQQRGPLSALEKDRPLFNLLIYSINVAVGSPEIVIRILPTILSVCLSIAVFWFVKVGTGNDRAALLSSLLSAFSFQITLGVFSYIAANWLAIIETLVLLTLLLKCFEKQSLKWMTIPAFVGIVLLLTHPYTWNIVMIIMASYLAWTILRRKTDGKSEIYPIILLLVANLLFYAVYSLMPFGAGLSQAEGWTLNGIPSNISLSSFISMQERLTLMVQTYVGGLLGNPLTILLTIAGMFQLMKSKTRINRLMLLWIAVPSLALPTTPTELYWRIIYLIPTQILTVAGLHWLLDRIENRIGYASPGASQALRVLKISLVVLVVFFLLNYALRSADESPLHILG